jgi:transcriptional regulator with XRE-family HTH domain
MSDVGKFILRVLKERKKSLRGLAREAVASSSYVSRLTRGLFVPTPEILIRLAPHLGVTRHRILQEAGWLQSEVTDAELPKVLLPFSVPVMYMRQADGFVAYTPALDLSTCGDTCEEAQTMFAEAVTIFFRELAEMGTLDEVLAECGWQKVSRPTERWVPPVLVGQAEEEVKIPLPA